MKKAVAFFGFMALFALSAADAGTFEQVLKLCGDKSETPVFYLNDGKNDSGSRTVRPFGKAWSPVQITHDGAGIRLKKDMGQFLTGSLPLAGTSFSCSVWIRPVSVHAPYSMVIANTTRPPCWGIRLFQEESAENFKAEVYYNWAIKGLPGNLLRAGDTFQTGNWYFFTVVMDREKEVMSFYVDGKLVDSVKMPKETPAFRDTFSVSSNPWYFDGQIYDLTFYPNVLSPDQIAAQFSRDGKLLKDAGNEK